MIKNPIMGETWKRTDKRQHGPSRCCTPPLPVSIASFKEKYPIAAGHCAVYEKMLDRILKSAHIGLCPVAQHW
jgi:hypothetical protein